MSDEQVNQPELTEASEPKQAEAPYLDTAEVQLHNALSLIAERQDQLLQEFVSKLKYDAQKERLIDTLHEQVSLYRTGLTFPILRPLVNDLVRLYDSMSEYRDRLQGDNPLDSKELIREMELFMDELAEALRQQGFEFYYTEVGQPFDSQLHKATKVLETSAADLDSCLAASRKPGVRYQTADGSFVFIRPEQVTVYKYVEQSTGVE